MVKFYGKENRHPGYGNRQLHSAGIHYAGGVISESDRNVCD